MGNMNYSIFAKSGGGNTSIPSVNCNIDLNTRYYAIFAYDRVGQVSERIDVKISYIVNHYAIFSEDGNNNISEASFVSCITQPIPFPTNIRIPSEFITATSFKIVWNPVMGISLYRIYIRNLITNDVSFFDSNQPEYVAINLRSNTLYEVYVASHIGSNIFSAYISPQVTKTLTTAIKIDAIPTQTSLRLYWQASTDVVLYTIYRGIPGTQSAAIAQIVAPRADGYLVENLSHSTQYTFSIIGTSANGNAIVSGMVATKTLADIPLPPNCLGFIIENITPYSFDIRWEPVADADFYALYLNYSEHAYIPFIYDIKTRVESLRPDTIYAVSILSINNAGRSESQPVMVRTSVAVMAEIPISPRLISPNPDYTTADSTPTLYWEVPSGAENDKYEFVVEIAEDQDFTKNVRKINSAINKKGFSYKSPREANSKETVNFKIQDALVIY